MGTTKHISSYLVKISLKSQAQAQMEVLENFQIESSSLLSGGKIAKRMLLKWLPQVSIVD